MRISFVKGGEGRPNWIYASLDDGRERSWSAPGGPGLPHDLVHFAVETELGLAHGFWGLVADGVDFAFAGTAAHHAGRRVRGLEGHELTELLQAEALAAATIRSLLPGLDLTDADWVAVAREGCAGAGVEPPAGLADDAARRTRDLIDGLLARWRSLQRGEALVLDYPSASRRSPAARSGG